MRARGRSHAGVVRLIAGVAIAIGLVSTAAWPIGSVAFASDPSCPGLVADARTALRESVDRRSLARARDALHLLDRASKLCPDDIEVPFLEGLAHAKLNSLDGVLAATRKCESLALARATELNRPRSDAANNPHVLFLQAVVHRQFGNKPGDAALTLKLLKNRDPGWEPEAVALLLFLSHKEFAGQLSRADDFEGAKREARLAQAAAGRNQSRYDDATHLYAKVLSQANEFPAAQPMLEDLAKRYPDDPDVRFTLAGVYAEQFQFDRAVDVWRETIRLLSRPGTDPALVDLLYDAPLRLGVCLAESKRASDGPVEGRKQLLEYIKAHPNDGRGWYFLGKVEVDKLDEPEAAIVHFEKARSLDPACEKTLRELYRLYSSPRDGVSEEQTKQEAAKAEALRKEIEQGGKARTIELNRRRRTRPDGSNGCY